jgi:hypothetical protein
MKDEEKCVAIVNGFMRQHEQQNRTLQLFIPYSDAILISEFAI